MKTYGTLLAALWAVFLAYWLISSLSAKRNVRSGLTPLALVLRLTGAVVVIVIASSRSFEHVAGRVASFAPSPVEGGAGIALCALGMAFAVWARLHIGRNWGMPMAEKEQPELVTTGPYAFVRHPIYTGILFAMLGSVLVVGPWYLVLVVPFALYFVYCGREEEKFLLRQFPAAYRDYMQRTKMLVPFVV